jgi:hypothetical protein
VAANGAEELAKRLKVPAKTSCKDAIVAAAGKRALSGENAIVVVRTTDNTLKELKDLSWIPDVDTEVELVELSS